MEHPIAARQLAAALLHWWQQHGRRAPETKPWMVTAEGTWPLPDQALDPYGIWIAEVMLHFATQEA